LFNNEIKINKVFQTKANLKSIISVQKKQISQQTKQINNSIKYFSKISFSNTTVFYTLSEYYNKIKFQKIFGRNIHKQIKEFGC
jgi:hypothetical protein